MGYRDELDAAQNRIASLEAELQSARARITELETMAPVAREVAIEAPTTVTPRRVGRIYFHPPRSYFPFVKLLAAAAHAAYTRAPYVRPLQSDRVIAHAWHYLFRIPFTYGVRWPLYVPAIAFGLTWAACLALVLTVVVMPFLVASRLSFSPNPPADEQGWFHGQADEEAGAIFLSLAICFSLAPLIPFTMSIFEPRSSA